MLRLVSVSILALAVSGCGMLPFESPEGIEAPKPFATTLGVSIPPSQAMAAIPIGAGQVISVVEKRRGNAIQHDITLAGAPPNYGENQINVTAFRYVDENPERPIDDKVNMTPPTEAEIYEEMRERIPGGPLPTSNAVPRNGMGAFGYAFGRRNGISCLYAWQWIDGQTRSYLPVGNKNAVGPVGIRVRLCRPGMTEEVLVDLVRQMYVVPRYDDGYRGTPMAGGYNPAMAGGYNPAMAGRMPAGGLAAGGYRPPMGYGVPTYAGNYGAQPTGYDGYGYGTSANYPKYGMPTYQAPMAVAAAPVRKKVVRRVVRRAAPVQTFSSSAPMAVERTVVAPGGYSAVPMPQ